MSGKWVRPECHSDRVRLAVRRKSHVAARASRAEHPKRRFRPITAGDAPAATSFPPRSDFCGGLLHMTRPFINTDQDCAAPHARIWPPTATARRGMNRAHNWEGQFDMTSPPHHRSAYLLRSRTLPASPEDSITRSTVKGKILPKKMVLPAFRGT